MVRQVKNLEEFNKILREAGDKLVVVDFTATWCGPCRMIAPVYEKMAAESENANVIFLKVDVDAARDVSSSCGIRSMPTFHFYKNGQKVHEFSGADQAKLLQKVAELR
ncbi:thioredoxin isoform X2 [Oreochromis niloticus]|uniref:Thioredoxin n=1 Tax=Oreochromis niloticus TaxID=8128 RepID=A0A669E0C2_ORENI|nr:thioredoxin isoform X2 [Oreochromis niloticus]